jgi:hypothetical protein
MAAWVELAMSRHALCTKIAAKSDFRVKWTGVYRQVGGSNPFLEHFSFKRGVLVRKHSFGGPLRAIRTSCNGSRRLAHLETVRTAAFQNGAKAACSSRGLFAGEGYLPGPRLMFPVRARVTLGAGAATSSEEMPCTHHD